MRTRTVFTTLAVLLTCVGAALQAASPTARAKTAADRPNRDIRAMAIAQAQIWAPTNIASLDIMSGPDDRRGFPFRADVHCDYTNKKMSGQSPKFSCVIAPDDTVKVKFGGTNGEVYGEVLATRLLWALGFGADHMYSVRVTCHKCPLKLLEIGDAGDRSAIEGSGGDLIFDPAAIERKMPGTEFKGTSGWAWAELERVSEEAGGATRAQRDALKLLAVFLQHGDNKPEQQRLACLGGWHAKAEMPCSQPFMMINDLGLTFGRSNTSNSNSIGGVNLTEWMRTPIWKDSKDPAKCVGNLSKSRTGSLGDPVISEEGRQFLASLLGQLSDRQLHDLFAVARVDLRLRTPDHVQSGYSTIDEWVAAFKEKRDEIVNRRCDS
jgi:hypothetical protein